MIIKKFTALSEVDAIELAKKELGKDAIVMNIKKVKPRGLFKLWMKEKVEVTAAVDETVSYGDNTKKTEKTVVPEKKLNKEDIYVNNAVVKEKKNNQIIIEEPSFSSNDSEISAIERKLNNLQELLEKQMKTKKNIDFENEMNKAMFSEETVKEENKVENCIGLVKKQLEENEVETEYVDQIMNEIKNSLPKDATVDYILAAVYQKIVLKLGQPVAINVKDELKKFVFLIGPTGVGKTTTIAKIASKLKLENKINVALVAADTYRIAAVEQLKTYANILEVPLKVIYTSNELVEQLEELKKFDLVLIDTAGRSHKNMDQTEDIKELIDCVPETERDVFLVLSAVTKYSDLKNISNIYNKITDYNLIFTKLDETTALGNILNIKLNSGKSLSYTTWGQNVPDDISVLDAQIIAKQLLGGNI